MTEEQERALKAAQDLPATEKSPLHGVENKSIQSVNENAPEHSVANQEHFKNKSDEPSDEQITDEITNNDGSIIETLDTAFHNKPGVIKDHDIAGSNRAEYYEARSQGKTDSEEEQDFLRKQHPE
jgi:hypothetical protein